MLYPEDGAMARRFYHIIAVAVFLLPARLMAGGPPFLCLPLDGVTTENVPSCTELLNSKLEKKLIQPESDSRYGVKLLKRADQWHLAFYMNDDVRLSDVVDAVSESPFSIPQDRLRLFGHVILEIDAPPESRSALLAGLDALPHVAVEESKTLENLFVVTVDMAYPKDCRPDLESIEGRTFQRNDFSSNYATKPRLPITLQELPTYETIRGVVSKHNARLKDMRWNPNYACRPLGGLAERPARTNKAGSGPKATAAGASVKR
jgi:hypothetical protein